MSKSEDSFDEMIDRLADRFEVEFRRGSKPLIEAYLSEQSSELGSRLLRELLPLELELRRGTGEQPIIDEYLERFPEYRSVVELVFVPATEVASTKTNSLDGQPKSAKAELPPEIGRYKIKGILGSGGFGVVYLGWDPDLKRNVAVKLARRDRFKTAEQVADFILEGSKTAGLKHDLLVTIFDVGKANGLPYIVQEYVEGKNLAEWTAQQQPSFEQIVQILMGVAEALGFVHQHRLTHCDLKLANVLMDQNGQPHVADFGLAVHESARLHSKGERFGTPSMMAPEQVRGEGHRLDGRTDIWAMGVMMYQLLVCQKPFTATDRSELFNEIETLDPKPPRQIDRTIPRELERICLKCLSKLRTDRYNTTDDLREDLQSWLTANTATEVPRSSADSASNKLSPSSHTLIPPPPKVIPKGLRSFDAKDANFFIELLPGPRDREGLPDSIRFWKDRIEETDVDTTFSVGLIYGPSGCGKTSLVKAGLLPRLSEAVLPIYIESTAGDTEVRVLKQLQKHFPRLTTDVSLVDAFRELRQTGAGRNRKILLVIDQFEQWLHSHQMLKQSQLVDSLRQCEGSKLQAILMVRGDFFESVNALFQELEIKLLEGKTYALVDRFDKGHARKVLTLFGQAYGDLDDELSPENEIFLKEVVDGLAEEAKVISVRLSLFADMMKSRAWTVDSLRDVGGVKGVGITFLEETFSARTAPPAHRVHAKAIRQLLKTLLPESGTDIKGRMQSEQVLCAAAGYEQGSPHFGDIINILDCELRIITPTEHDGEGLASDGIVTDKYYQLTHDYLIPSLRSWLTQKLQETRKGRAELTLQERAALWNAKPENRYLPTLWEHVEIRLLLNQEYCTESKRPMMKAADRFYGLWLGIFVASLSMILYLMQWRENSRRSVAAEELVGRIVSAKPYEVVPMVLKDPQLQVELEHGIHGNNSKLSRFVKDQGELERQLRKKLKEVREQPNVEINIRLGLLSFDPSEALELTRLMLRASNDGDIEAIARYLAPFRQLIANELVTAASDKTKSNHERLVAIAALGIIASDESFWNEGAKEIATLIVREDLGKARLWGRILRKIGQLEEPLDQAFRDWKQSSAGSSAAAALAEYLIDSPKESCKLIVSADSQQCRILAEGLTRQQSVALEILSKTPAEKVDERTNIICAQLILGDGTSYWAALSELEVTGDPTLRSHLIARWQSTGRPPQALIEKLKTERDAAIVQATLMILHGLPELVFTEVETEEVVDRLRKLLIHPDSGVHSAAELVLRKWKRSDVIDAAKLPSAPDMKSPPTTAGWFVDKNNHVMVWIPRDREFNMGLRESPASEIAPLHKRRIARSVAIASKETTVSQFSKLCRSDDLIKKVNDGQEPEWPVMNVNWSMMARYCNWLSEYNKIPPQEWCYRDEGSEIVLAEDFLDKSGYRLPTEAEWEYFCRAGTSTDWYCGNDPSILNFYAWSSQNPQIPEIRRSSVGQLLPNRFGLFDMSGNVWEYCQTRLEAYSITDERSLLSLVTGDGVTRGGSYENTPKEIRSGYRMTYQPKYGTGSHGFRVARTLPNE